MNMHIIQFLFFTLLVKTDANHHLALIIGRSEDKVRNFIDTYDDAHPGDSADMTTGQLLE